MYPNYSSGDVVACTIIKESSFIQWNKTYVIATKEQGIIIKRLKKSDSEDYLLMISDNKSYEPFEVNKKDITGIALVVGVIRLE
jgi:phage repressor protein C with HTH and peptisase S24 domain